MYDQVLQDVIHVCMNIANKSACSVSRPWSLHRHKGVSIRTGVLFLITSPSIPSGNSSVACSCVCICRARACVCVRVRARLYVLAHVYMFATHLNTPLRQGRRQLIYYTFTHIPVKQYTITNLKKWSNQVDVRHFNKPLLFCLLCY
jgi:hypothetical protein